MDEVFTLIDQERQRQENGIELIASENWVSKEVLAAQGSILTNKYAEGYPGKRYYGGCEVVDKIEQLAIDRAKKLFNADFVNVQPYSGSGANMAVYDALLKAGDTVLGMNLTDGGHLTHGSPVNFSGRRYHFVSYGVDPESEQLDYSAIRQTALEAKPKMIVAGYSAYSRKLDFKAFRQIADEVGALLMVDMAHFAGLVAAGIHENPVDYADVVTSTTHKTLRGPRGAIILTNNPDYAKKINSRIFPGNQGGPLLHVIAAKAVAFQEALNSDFKDYMENVVINARAMASEFSKAGIHVVSGGTDNHLIAFRVSDFDLTGKAVEEKLGQVHITVNKNTIPGETLPPTQCSGIRIGTPAITTRGFTADDCRLLAQLIVQVVKYFDDDQVIAKVKEQVKQLTQKYPLSE
ncbi:MULTISPECIES: serine hydroxymethyltransferase [Aerococcus]|uniref:Serine hydroxymethyltransferase n=2 Tax=Aerococcus TaxID=1375 RepID=A0A1E9PQY7_9LACT|nr:MULTISPECIES: serine hydroxymethyltransferase [Aerococcus]KAA9239995.1 serine hydroxymethyltransferase [Aerococcus urinae]KAA9291426.1 serine hydroxymethyltransferase [Aerococcus mictus]MBU5609958.1 serine hydroxymethyltransferase [Aerococcus urinae]MCY3034448.1 serine hydroxymethyltransferase [Aerococcus mictus]MCY3063711.1 serine hydroxymethyltransferase [Aerococcus mictus]